jgi:hypothetical protein
MSTRETALARTRAYGQITGFVSYLELKLPQTKNVSFQMRFSFLLCVSHYRLNRLYFRIIAVYPHTILAHLKTLPTFLSRQLISQQEFKTSQLPNGAFPL